MNRITLILTLIAAGGCASTQAPGKQAAVLTAENQRLRLKIAALEAAANRTPRTSALTRSNQLPLVAYVEHRPDWCNGALCLKLVNLRSYPIGWLAVDGQPVAVLAPGGLIWPRQAAYIRLFQPGHYAITAHLLDAIHTPIGLSSVSRVVVERCSLTRRIPTPADHADGYARADFDTLDCAS